MLRLPFLVFISLLTASAHSENLIRIQAPIKYIESWLPAEDVVTQWISTRPLYDCSNWVPHPSEVLKGKTFTQSSNDCKTDQERTVTKVMRSKSSGEYKIINTYVESQTLTGQVSTRNSIGTKVIAPPASITINGVGVFIKPTLLPDGRVFYLFEKHVNVLELGAMFGVQIHYNYQGRISRSIDGKTITLGVTEDLVSLFNHLRSNGLSPYGNTGYWTNSWNHRIGSVPTLVAVSPSGSINYIAGSVGSLQERPVILHISY